MLFFLILSIIINCTLGVLVFYSLRRINNYESLMISLQRTVEYINEKVRQIDLTGHFEGDDEIGFFFTEVKQLNGMLSGIFEDDNNPEEDVKDGE
jgi:hypothetical protein